MIKGGQKSILKIATRSRECGDHHDDVRKCLFYIIFVVMLYGRNVRKIGLNRQQKAVWDSGSLTLLIKMSVRSIFLILRCVQGSGPEGDDVL